MNSKECPNLNNNPNCKKVQIYSSTDVLKTAIDRNSVCKSCAKFGKSNPMYEKQHIASGKSYYDVWLEKYGKESAIMKYENFIKNHSKSKLGKNNPMFGKSVFNMWMEKHGEVKANEMRTTQYEKISGKNNSHYGKSNYDLG